MNERHDAGGISRRRLLQGGAGALGVTALGGCAPGVASSTQELSFWHLLSGPDGATMDQLIADFNSDVGSEVVTPTILAWGSPYYTKLAMASAGGRAPDVAIMHAGRLPGYAPGGLLDMWDMDLFAEFDIYPEDFPERVWEATQYQGQPAAIALDSHPFVLYFNTDLADQAGVLDSDGALPETDDPEEFRALAAELGAVSPSGYGIAYGYLGDGSNMWRMFSTYYTQMGGTMELPEGGTVQYDEGLAIDTLEWIMSLIDGELGNSSHDGGTAISEFATGRTALFYGGVWETGNYRAQGVPFDITMVPTVFGTPAAYADSHAFVLPYQSNPDPDARRRVHEFVASVLKNSLSWAEAGHIPAYNPVVDSPEYGELVPQSHYAQATDYLVYDPPAWFTGSGSDFSTYFGHAIQSVFMGMITPHEGLTQFTDRINTLLSRPSPVGDQ